MIFPFYKRATAIGICNLIARAVTISSSLVVELPRPWPASILITLTAISLVDAIFLPSYEAEVQFEKQQADLAEASKEQGKELESDKDVDQNEPQ